MKIEIYLKLYATLAKYMPDKSIHNPWMIKVDNGTTVKKLLEQLNIPLGDVKIIFLNSVYVTGEEVLNDQDRIGVFPLVAGG